jgi:hypothetical protein
MDITRRHESWISQYIALAEELKSLISQTAAAYSTTEFGNSTANIKAALDAFYEYKRDTKPQYQAILASLQGLYATITASSKSNNRPAWVPPEGLSLVALAEAWKVRACCSLCPPRPDAVDNLVVSSPDVGSGRRRVRTRRQA